ncbi:hypothetical protein GCM10020221_17860 [Streptomyces thioluteus]|uniref:Uncharacterized protein n=1 Tax=Streptomyces thioluteus TaxID=66431 RepID=A0ABP6J5W7_STRTU
MRDAVRREQVVGAFADGQAARLVGRARGGRDAVRRALARVEQVPQQRVLRAPQIGLGQPGLDQRGGPHGRARHLGRDGHEGRVPDVEADLGTGAGHLQQARLDQGGHLLDPAGRRADGQEGV